jgi:peptide-methionine (S)-S-oxide reductase
MRLARRGSIQMKKGVVPVLFIGAIAAVIVASGGDGAPGHRVTPDSTQLKGGMETATFGAGCFWCVEAVFQEVDGVESVVSGYSGGARPDPTYGSVSTGVTGHAEACQITYDPKKITYAQLLEIFWKTHDPTTKDRQGNDAGTQYRSVIFTHNEEQKTLAEHYRTELDAAGIYEDPIVTEIVPFKAFYRAEGYHQDYFLSNPDQAYCRFVIQPKVEKFRKVFSDKLKNK